MDLFQLTPPEPKPSRNTEKTVLVILSIIGTVAAVVGGLKGYPLLLQIGFFVVAAVALFAAFVIPFLWSHWQIWKNKRNAAGESFLKKCLTPQQFQFTSVGTGSIEPWQIDINCGSIH